MQRPWFRPWGWIWRPVSLPGWVATTLALLFCAQVSMVIDRHAHSVTDTLYGCFPFIVPTLLGLDWLASRTGAPRER